MIYKTFRNAGNVILYDLRLFHRMSDVGAVSYGVTCDRDWHISNDIFAKQLTREHLFTRMNKLSAVLSSLYNV